MVNQGRKGPEAEKGRRALVEPLDMMGQKGTKAQWVQWALKETKDQKVTKQQIPKVNRDLWDNFPYYDIQIQITSTIF